MRCSSRVLPAMVLLCTLALPAAGAMIRVPIEDSIAASDLVIRARTLDSRCEWSRDGKWIFTFVRLQVIETIGGRAAGEEVVVRVPGGERDGVGLRVSDTPSFEAGDESVLFLSRSAEGGFLTVVDGFQGKNTLRDGKVVERDLPESVFVGRVREIVRATLGGRER